MNVTSIKIIAKHYYAQKVFVDEYGEYLDPYENLSKHPVKTVYQILTEENEILPQEFSSLGSLRLFVSEHISVTKEQSYE